MKSPPTSILHSIHQVKSKLRNDNIEFEKPNRDFPMKQIKTTIEDQKQQQLFENGDKIGYSLQKNQRNVIDNLVKNHQNQIKSIIKEYSKEKEEMLERYDNKIQEIKTLFQHKIKLQCSYIEILEQQLQQSKNCNSQQMKNNPSKSKQKQAMNLYSKIYEINFIDQGYKNRFKLNILAKNNESKNYDSKTQTDYNYYEQYHSKYSQIINNLIKQNAALVQNILQLKRALQHTNPLVNKSKSNTGKQNHNIFTGKHGITINSRKKQQQKQQQSARPIIQKNSRQSSRNIFKNKNNRFKIQKTNPDKSSNFTDRSYLSLNAQNIDTSNIIFRNALSIERDQKQQQKIMEDDEESILSEDAKLRTIKHFMKGISHRLADDDKREKYPTKKYQKRGRYSIINAYNNI